MAGTRTTPHRLMEFHVFGCDSLSPPPELPAELYHTTQRVCMILKEATAPLAPAKHKVRHEARMVQSLGCKVSQG